MAMIVNIRTVDSDTESGEITSIGNCSSCDNQLISQPVHGFPAICPYCGNLLENGKDTREWIKNTYPARDRKSD